MSDAKFGFATSRWPSLVGILGSVFTLSECWAASYFYPTQLFECTISEANQSMFVSQFTEVCISVGILDMLNVTVPYGRSEMPDLDLIRVKVDWAEESDWIVSQYEEGTVVQITLPKRLYSGENCLILTEYCVQDLPGEAGFSADRDGKTLAVFRAPVFEEALVKELVIWLFPPPGCVATEWSPVADSALSRYPKNGRLGVVWRIVSNIEQGAEYKVLYQKQIPEAGMPMGVVLVGILVFGTTTGGPCRGACRTWRLRWPIRV